MSVQLGSALTFGRTAVTATLASTIVAVVPVDATTFSRDESEMQTEDKILIAVGLGYALVLGVGIALDKFRFVGRVLESALIAPATLLSLVRATYGIVLFSPGRLAWGAFLFLYGGLLGIVALWAAMAVRMQYP